MSFIDSFCELLTDGSEQILYMLFLADKTVVYLDVSNCTLIECPSELWKLDNGQLRLYLSIG